MPDFVTPSDSENPEVPSLAPAEDIPEGIPADALPATDDAETGTEDMPVYPDPVPLTADRALNIAFGAALLLTDATKAAVQKLGEQAEFVQNNAPAVLDALEEKGKPARDAIMEKLRDAVGFGYAGESDDTDAGDLPKTSGEIDIDQELPQPDSMVSNGAAPFVPPISGGSAEAEISALERRVRELEQEVSKPLGESESAPLASNDALPPSDGAANALAATEEMDEETPAEVATYDFASDVPDALADSPYAVSETPEETAGETQANGETNEVDLEDQIVGNNDAV